MTTATISLSPTGRPAAAGRAAPAGKPIAGRSATAGRTTPAGATPASALSTTRAAVLSVLGSMLAIGVAAIGVLVVPIAALVAFGPALLQAF
ncbi:hypothetical protein [Microbacterium aurum]